MRSIREFELPEHLRKLLLKAVRLEWITLIYLLSVVVIMYMSLGSSQAMKTAWMEDLLGLVPSIAFLIATKVNSKPANKKFPYGYHRVYSISFLVGAVALLGMGIFLIFDSAMALIKKDHPTIGNILIFEKDVWMGWIMIAALLYSSIPAMILGFKKLPYAKKLHNKVLLIDAKAQKADYMTALAAILGILGIGVGLWWADALAAFFISSSILKDGFTYTKTAILDLMDREPVTLEKRQHDPLIDQVKALVNSWDWVKESEVRFREHGQVYFGEIAIVPKDQVSMGQLDEAYEVIRDQHWKIFDFTIAPVVTLPAWNAGKK